MTEKTVTPASRKVSFRERNRRSEGYLMRRKAGRVCVSVVRGILLIGLCFMIVQPLLTRFLQGLMMSDDLYDSTVRLIPRHVTLENYRLVIELTNMPKSLLNTAWIALLISACQVICATLVGYAFARFEFPLKKMWFGFVVLLIIVPPQTIQVPLYLHFMNFDVFGIFKALTGKPLALRGSIWPYTMMSLTCMGIKNGLFIFLLREYFKGIPISLEEAAYVDGCSNVHTFVKIMLPDALPIIASCFLFSFVWQWTDSFYTSNFLTGYSTYSSAMQSLSDRVKAYYSVGDTLASVSDLIQTQLASISILFCSVPLIVLYCFTQKTFVQSIVMSGSKE